MSLLRVKDLRKMPSGVLTLHMYMYMLVYSYLCVL